MAAKTCRTRGLTQARKTPKAQKNTKLVQQKTTKVEACYLDISVFVAFVILL